MKSANGYKSNVIAVKMAAGRATALADFNAGRFQLPVYGDCTPWASGYRLAVQEIAQTFGRDAARAAGGLQ